MEHSDMANVKIERTKLWPTNIYCFNTDVSILQHHDKMETDLKVDLKQNYTEIESGKEVGFNLYQGRDNLQNLESFKPFTEFVKNICGGIFNQEGYEKQEIEVTQMWANLQVDGGVHPPHTPANSLLSGVYYLRATDDTAGTQFFDPRAQAKVLKPRRANANMENSGVWQVPSATGTGVIFPSWLQHWVPSNTDERITLSWNTIVRGEYGEPGTLQNANI